jgi:hypothetical protein
MRIDRNSSNKSLEALLIENFPPNLERELYVETIKPIPVESTADTTDKSTTTSVTPDANNDFSSALKSGTDEATTSTLGFKTALAPSRVV